MLDSRKLLAAGCASLVLGAASAAGATAMAPKIAAKPHKLMVGAETALKGKGFPPNASIELRECGKTFWLAPSDPCLEEGATVTTDAKGRFQTTFKVGLCPEGEATKKPTQRVCYVGELIIGEDTGSLAGDARLVVTYP